MRIWYQSEVLERCGSVGWGRDRRTKENNQIESAEGWGKGRVAKLVPDICVSVPNKPQDMEAECQEPSAKQVPQSSQVRDGEVVWVQASAPHPVYHPVCDVQEDQHLEQCSGHVEDDEDEGESGMPTLHAADGVEEHQVSWDHEKEEDPGRAGIYIRTEESGARAGAAARSLLRALPGHPVHVQEGGDAAGLHRHQISPNTINHRCEDSHPCKVGVRDSLV